MLVTHFGDTKETDKIVTKSCELSRLIEIPNVRWISNLRAVSSKGTARDVRCSVKVGCFDKTNFSVGTVEQRTSSESNLFRIHSMYT